MLLANQRVQLPTPWPRPKTQSEINRDGRRQQDRKEIPEDKLNREVPKDKHESLQDGTEAG